MRSRRGAFLAVVVGLACVWASAPAVAGAPAGAHAAALYNLRAAPRASFVWLPALPHTGERVELISTSTDMTSPIVAYAWDLSGDESFGTFQAGGPSTSTTFSTPASHPVRLRVTSADHLSTVVAETVTMGDPPPGVLRPFPNVRIRGRLVHAGVRLSTLSVRAPSGALITIRCLGRGCPRATAARSAASALDHEPWTSFRAFERLLPAGVTLYIRVSKSGEIGAYTRFTVRHRKLPVRADACLSPTGTNPIACPLG